MVSPIHVRQGHSVGVPGKWDRLRRPAGVGPHIGPGHPSRRLDHTGRTLLSYCASSVSVTVSPEGELGLSVSTSASMYAVVEESISGVLPDAEYAGSVFI